MIPILFSESATTFTSEGIGRLSDALSCTVLEKLNGEFELTMEYPATGVHYEDLVNDAIIVCDASRDLKRQAFRIYKVSKPLNGKMTVNAAHISYDLNYIPVQPFTATGFANAAAGLVTNSLETNPFTITTHDITNTTTVFALNVPKSCRACLGGSEESLMQSFSGSTGIEYTFDNYTVYADLHRGKDRGYELRFAKNITNLNQSDSVDDTITGVIPIWHNDDNSVVYVGSAQYNSHVGDYPFNRTVVYDCTSKFDTEPTATDLNTEGSNYINQSGKGVPAVNITVSFVDLYGTSSYAAVQPLETVCMGDTIRVYFGPLGISETREVIETKWNVLKGRYDSIVVGVRKNNIADTLHSMTTDINNNTNELISVNLRIDYEEGVISSTISSVEDLATTVATHTTQIEQNADAISQRVTSTELTNALEDYVTETQLSSELQQTSDSLTATFTSIVSGEVDNQLSTWVRVDGTGITIAKSDSNVKAVFTNTSLDFKDTDNNKLAWLDASEGLGATKISVGDPNSSANRWSMIVSADGNHLRFTRHK